MKNTNHSAGELRSAFCRWPLMLRILYSIKETTYISIYFLKRDHIALTNSSGSRTSYISVVKVRYDMNHPLMEVATQKQIEIESGAVNGNDRWFTRFMDEEAATSASFLSLSSPASVSASPSASTPAFHPHSINVHSDINSPPLDNNDDEFGYFEFVGAQQNTTKADNGNGQFLFEDEFGEFAAAPATSLSANGDKQSAASADGLLFDFAGSHQSPANFTAADLFDSKNSVFSNQTLDSENGSRLDQTPDRNTALRPNEVPDPKIVVPGNGSSPEIEFPAGGDSHEIDDEWGDFVEIPVKESGQHHGNFEVDGFGFVHSEKTTNGFHDFTEFSYPDFVSGSTVDVKKNGNFDFTDLFGSTCAVNASGNGSNGVFDPFGNLNSVERSNGEGGISDQSKSNGEGGISDQSKSTGVLVEKSNSNSVSIDRDISKPLPLFLFGEDEDFDSKSDVEGINGVNLLNDSPTCQQKFNCVQTPSMSGLKLNDFIANLYEQAGKDSSPLSESNKEGTPVQQNEEGKQEQEHPFGDGMTSDTVNLKNSSLGKEGEDSELSELWEFKDAFCEDDGINASKFSHEQKSSPVDGNVDTKMTSSSSLFFGNDNEDDDASSWEFKDASSEPLSHSQFNSEHVPFEFNQPTNSSEGSEDSQREVSEFYVKLRAYSYSLVLTRLSELEKTLSVASESNNEEEEMITKEIQTAREKLEEANDVSELCDLEDPQLKTIAMEELLEHVCHSSLLVFDSAFHLSELISSAKQNSKVAMDLYRHAVWVLLLVSISTEDQCAYLDVWATITSACLRELQHGLTVWNQASDANVHIQILSHPQGKGYFASLMEIFRVSEILRASMKIYKPWILLNPSQANYISSNLASCMAAWFQSGLKEAMHHTLAKDDCNNVISSTWKAVEEITRTVEFMKELCPADAAFSAYQEHQPVCRLSLLPTNIFHGLKVVDWSGQSYFLLLANLWANCVSCKSPQLPAIDFKH